MPTYFSDMVEPTKITLETFSLEGLATHWCEQVKDEG